MPIVPTYVTDCKYFVFKLKKKKAIIICAWHYGGNNAGQYRDRKLVIQRQNIYKIYYAIKSLFIQLHRRIVLHSPLFIQFN